jgi:AcrR family transcriptional regulator
MQASGRAAETKRSRAPKGQGDKLRNDILRATEQLLVETGDESAVSMRAIAEAVGCTPPAIYMHFADKEELIFEVCNARWAEFNEALDRAGDRSDDPLESLRNRGRAYIRFGMENPEHYRLLMMTKTDDPHEDIEDLTKQGAVAFQHLVGAVVRCIDSGAFGPIDPFMAAIVVWSAVHGITSLLVTAPNFPWPDLEQTIETVLDSQLGGLAAR